MQTMDYEQEGIMERAWIALQIIEKAICENLASAASGSPRALPGGDLLRA